jgi:hypothetical protein
VVPIASRADRSTARISVLKAAREQRYTLAIAYPADRVDRHGEFMSAADLERTAWNYAANHRQVGLIHLDGTEGAGTVVESYIYRGPDWQMPTPSGPSVVVKSGDWLLGILWDRNAWRLIRTGQLNGLSMQGKAVRKRLDAA